MFYTELLTECKGLNCSLRTIVKLLKNLKYSKELLFHVTVGFCGKYSLSTKRPQFLPDQKMVTMVKFYQQTRIFIHISETFEKSLAMLGEMITECSNTLEEMVDMLKLSHWKEMLVLLTIKNGYDVKVNKTGKKRTDRIIEESIKKKLCHERLYKLCEETEAD